MRSSAILTTSALLLTLPLFGGAKPQDKPAKSSATSRFEQFKALEGEWEGKETGMGESGAPVKITYHVTSGGSAVAETIGPGTDHEMITMITKDGANVMLTHYCAVGNQPHMKAPDAGSGNACAFKFTSAGNMASDQDTHMHNATYTFIDKDNIKTVWTLYVKGKPSGDVSFVLKRKK